MTTLQQSIVIEAPRSKVWAKLADLAAVEDYSIDVAKAWYTTEAREGLGATRVCDLLPFGRIEEEVLAWDEGRSMTLSVVPIKAVPPFVDTTGSFHLEDVPGGTRVDMSFDYRLKGGIFGKLLGFLFVTRQFRGSIEKTLAGLKLHLEEGALIDKASKPALKAVLARAA